MSIIHKRATSTISASQLVGLARVGITDLPVKQEGQTGLLLSMTILRFWYTG